MNDNEESWTLERVVTENPAGIIRLVFMKDFGLKGKATLTLDKEDVRRILTALVSLVGKE